MDIISFSFLQSSKINKSRRTSSAVSLTPQHLNTSFNGDLSLSGEDLSTSTHLLSTSRFSPIELICWSSLLACLGDLEMRPSRIPIPIAMSTPAPSIISRTSSRESIISEQSSFSISSSSQRKASKLPLAVSRQKKSTTNGTTSTKTSWVIQWSPGRDKMLFIWLYSPNFAFSYA